MTIFAVDPERQKDEAADKLALAYILQANALSAYEQDPSRDNEIAVRAATRLLEETTAEFDEWVVE